MHVPSLNMSNIIATDAPLLSPSSDHWDHSGVDTFPINFPHYALASPAHSLPSSTIHSPLPTTRMLKSMSRRSPDTSSESEHSLCVPTHQVFDFAPTVPSSPSPTDPDSLMSAASSIAGAAAMLHDTTSLVPSKRAASTAPTATKKTRTAVSTKDFIPPDVTGLSKREARLVKNRAAAFLSRQRKREEFEIMEVRVAELEEENARLLALASKSGDEPNNSGTDLVSEVEQLRRELAAAQERERALSDQLSQKAVTTPSTPTTVVRPEPIKMEAMEPELPSRPGSVPPQKSGASFGLMVLLCALPTLLSSVQTHSTFPATFSFPLSDSSSLASTSAFDLNSFLPDFGFNTESSIMDLDTDTKPSRLALTSGSSATKKLEFVDVDSEALGLSELDISFDTVGSQDGKIRVRIHPSSAASSTAVTAAPSPSSSGDHDDQSMWGGSEVSGPTSSSSTPDLSASPSSMGTPNSSVDSDPLGPFLSMGGLDKSELDFLSHLSGGMGIDGASEILGGSSIGALSESTFDFGFGSSSLDGYSVGPSSASSAGRRRVRIALKSLPGEGREGGEWEVQVC